MNEFLTQSQLAERLVQKTGIRPEIAKQFSSVFFTIVKKGLKDSTSFAVHGFGTFKKTWIEATTGLNPSSGEKINIPAHWRIKFVPCSAVAKRLNRPYENLTAKEVPEDTILPEEDPTSSIPAAIVQPAEDDDDEEIDEEENTVTKKNLKLLALAGVILLFLILLLSLLLRGCSSKKSGNSKKKSTTEKSLLEKANEVQDALEDNNSAATEIGYNEDTDLTIASLMFAKFAVPDGSDYHTIAEEKYGNRHLWPILFAANKDLSSDPDFVAKYRSIKVPELPEGPVRDKVISSAVLEAYNAYLLMCEKQPESKKNPERKRLATRVLVSGELLVPGFLAEYNNRILPEYAELAQNIVLHQYQ